jgi:hypothetical protein
MSGSEQPATTAYEAGSQAGYYLYGIGRPGPVTSPLTLPDLDIRLFAIRFGDLAAIVQEVSLDEYSEDVITARLQDHEWLIEAARRHHEIVAHIHRITPVLPAKFGTVYESKEAVRDAVSETHDKVLQRLEAIDGCDEWALHFFGDEDELREQAMSEDVEITQMRAELESATPGRAYLLRQRIAGRIDQSFEEFQHGVVRNVFHQIRHLVREFESDPPNREMQTEQGESEIARAVALVPRDHAEEFLEALDSSSATYRGLRIDVTGPWPPYTFANLEDES